MKKKLSILLALSALTLSACGCGGGGEQSSSAESSVESSGEASSSLVSSSSSSSSSSSATSSQSSSEFSSAESSFVSSTPSSSEASQSSEIPSSSSESSSSPTPADFVDEVDFKSAPTPTADGKLTFKVTAGEYAGNYQLVLPKTADDTLYGYEETVKPRLGATGKGTYTLKQNTKAAYAAALLEANNLYPEESEEAVSIPEAYLEAALAEHFSKVATVEVELAALPKDDAKMEQVGENSVTLPTFDQDGELIFKINAGGWQQVYGILLPRFSNSEIYEGKTVPASREKGAHIKYEIKDSDGFYDYIMNHIYSDYSDGSGKAKYVDETHTEEEKNWFSSSVSLTIAFMYLGASQNGNNLTYPSGMDPKFSEQLSYEDAGDGKVIVTGVQSKYAANLTTIDIPSSISEGENLKQVVGTAAKAFKDNKAIKELYVGKDVENLGENAFENATALDTVSFEGEEDPALITIPDNCFAGCSALETMKGMERVGQIGERAFKGATKLKEIAFFPKLNAVGEKAFEGCKALEKATFNLDSDEATVTIASYAFAELEALTEVTFITKEGKGKLQIEDHAFYHCIGLTDLDGCEALTYIGESAFEGCAQLQSKLTFGTKLTTIGKKAFYGCAMYDVIFEDSPCTINDYAFAENTHLDRLVLGSAISGIGDYAFFGCTKMYWGAKVTLPASLKVYGEGVFGKTGATLELQEGSKILSMKDGILWGDDSDEIEWNLILHINADGEVTSYEFPLVDDVTYNPTKVTPWACSNNFLIEDIAFSYALLQIQEGAFFGCKNLTMCDLSLTECGIIGNYAFEDCVKLDLLSFDYTSANNGRTTYKGSLMVIGERAFANTGFSTLNLSREKGPLNAGLIIMDGAFAGCKYLELIYLPALLDKSVEALFDGVPGLGRGIFADCPELSGTCIAIDMDQDDFDTKVRSSGTYDDDGDPLTEEKVWHWYDELPDGACVHFKDGSTIDIWAYYGATA